MFKVNNNDAITMSIKCKVKVNVKVNFKFEIFLINNSKLGFKV